MDVLAGEYDVICTETINIDRGDNGEYTCTLKIYL
jgi:hypothetical protein